MLQETVKRRHPAKFGAICGRVGYNAEPMALLRDDLRGTHAKKIRTREVKGRAAKIITELMN